MLRHITEPRSNWTPRSLEEADAVRAFLRQLEGMDAVESHTASTQLVDSLDVINRALERVRGLISAFKRLPDDILAKIFEQFILFRKEFDSRPKALILCGVSRRWRAVAFSTPSLWTSLELVVRPGWDPIFERICLSRSSPLPVNVNLRCRDYTPSELDEAIRLISRNISRIRNLSLDFQPHCNGRFNSPPALVFPAIKTGSVSANQLTILAISVPPGTIAWEWISAVVQTAPKLTGMSFVGDLIPNTPWSQLVHLSLGAVSVIDGLRILSQATRLRDCDFIITSSAQPPKSRPAIVHSLKCLLLERDERDRNINVTEFLAHVQLPELISLAIVDEQGIWHHHRIISFLSRSSCHLRRFILVDTPISGAHIRNILRHRSMAKLKSLKLERCRGAMTPLLVHELTGTEQQPPLIQGLKMIYLGPVRCNDRIAAFVATLCEKGGYEHRLLPGAPSMGTTFTFDIADSECD